MPALRERGRLVEKLRRVTPELFGRRRKPLRELAAYAVRGRCPNCGRTRTLGSRLDSTEVLRTRRAIQKRCLGVLPRRSATLVSGPAIRQSHVSRQSRQWWCSYCFPLDDGDRIRLPSALMLVPKRRRLKHGQHGIRRSLRFPAQKKAHSSREGPGGPRSSTLRVTGQTFGDRLCS
jgi:hypothetical protein